MSLSWRWRCCQCHRLLPAGQVPETASLEESVRFGRCPNLDCTSRAAVRHKIKGLPETSSVGTAAFLKVAYDEETF
jgi:hypothetical protein